MTVYRSGPNPNAIP